MISKNCGEGVNRGVDWHVDTLVRRDFQDDRVVCKRDKPIITQSTSFNPCSTIALPASYEEKLSSVSQPFSTRHPQYCLNRLIIRDPSTLSEGETDAESPSTDVKNPRYDGVLVHFMCDMEAHCDWMPVCTRLRLNVRGSTKARS